ncbi:hypothetical protein EV421DRAFT_1721842, partial [Armillaria borealis]
ELICIPDLIYKGCSIKDIIIDKGHSLLAHLESWKMLMCSVTGRMQMKQVSRLSI